MRLWLLISYGPLLTSLSAMPDESLNSFILRRIILAGYRPSLSSLVSVLSQWGSWRKLPVYCPIVGSLLDELPREVWLEYLCERTPVRLIRDILQPKDYEGFYERLVCPPIVGPLGKGAAKHGYFEIRYCGICFSVQLGQYGCVWFRSEWMDDAYFCTEHGLPLVRLGCPSCRQHFGDRLLSSMSGQCVHCGASVWY